ncbi:ADP-ribosylation factor-like protein 13B isoform X2 [Liolophura sinensis]|uniref:ADP-ribosylation factor-like protein 13B isoform X2 n=1 Tax=Liolophura sinensis TaxID=3198878 RepID=UPI0031593E09
MFSLMGNCLSARKSTPRRELTLAILGLDNAGKTVTANILQGETLHTAPTIGFQKSDLKFGRYDLTLFDLGGGKKIRAIWKKYLAEVYGVVYLVDASDSSRIEESTAVFKELLEDPKVTQKPVLVLANKQDVDGALDEMDICDQMRLEEVVNTNKCPCRVEMCSAIKGTGRKKDSRIKEGLQWLCDMIDLDFGRLNARVREDLRVQDIERKKDLEERKARVQKIREQREKEEEEERKRLGMPEAENPAEDTIDGDPFKKLDYEELKQKEARLKEEKKKKKAMLDRNDNRACEPVSRQLTTGLSSSLQADDGNDDDDDDDDIVIASPSPRHSKLPPLHYQKQLKHDKHIHRLEENRQMENQEENIDNHSDSKLSANQQNVSGMENGYLGMSWRGAGSQLAPLGKPVAVEKVEKKRRKRVKKNKLVPLDGQLEVVNQSSLSPAVSPALPWETNNHLGSPNRTQDHQAHNWGLVEDLPELTSPVELRRGKPNFDSDDIVT